MQEIDCLVLSCLQPSSIRGLVALWTSLLHFLLSLVFSNRSSNGIPVHSSMLSIHRILGIPCFLVPGVVPCMISFSRQSPSFLITCPKYDNFLLLIMLSSPWHVPFPPSPIPIRLFSSVSTIPLEFFVCISSQTLQFFVFLVFYVHVCTRFNSYVRSPHFILICSQWCSCETSSGHTP